MEHAAHPDFKAFAARLQNPVVRDLYWAVAGPGLLSETALPDILPDALQQSWVQENRDWFIALDRNPEQLEDRMRALKTIRLGHRFEALIHYFFEHVPAIDLLTSNLQIIESGLTLGELDFVIRYNHEVYHIEVAVKYYCGAGDGQQMRDWIGPSAKDRLDLKWKHLQHKQLPIGTHPQVKEHLSEKIDRHFCWMKGKVFTETEAIWPGFLSPRAEKGQFRHLSDLSGISFQNDACFILERPDWMSDLWAPSDRIRPISPDEIPRIFAENLQFLDALHLGYETGNGYATAFIVADSWPAEKVR